MQSDMTQELAINWCTSRLWLDRDSSFLSPFHSGKRFVECVRLELRRLPRWPSSWVLSWLQDEGRGSCSSQRWPPQQLPSSPPS
jgi:hypothetical protein